MKVILIKDDDAKALVDKLELIKLKKRRGPGALPESPVTHEEMHRIFHYEVCKWLQDQGASLT